ncbi:uncharacterized protein LOC125494782 [Beta vulgaris subsp. vulgaris]|uniref:uncharacterized protein LOC125494782 n=1 Tax=Beta vulgaris subsp. vulgaris TaxID=3555 RepID=UPI002548070C|nr:uncharacterized protein LOC125494782 [Beta vulgaris subsp. vulgaris]
MPTDESVPPVQNDVVDDNEGEDSSRTEVERGKVDDVEKCKEKVTNSRTPPLPFPHRMQKSKVDQQLGKFMSMVKNLEVTVPFTDLISQVPVYAKFLKDMITKKRDFGGIDRVSLTEECSAVLQNKIPPKLKDPGSFSIPCHVGSLFIDKAWCDLGSSVSVMPLSICNKLNLGALKCIQITLQMVDRSVKYPLGILEDVPVRVGKFYIPLDFIVLDMEEDSQISIILGRPFLCTAGAVIDVKSGSLTLSVGDDTITFKIDILDEISGVSFSQFLSDELLETNLDLHDDLDIDTVVDCKVMETICSTSDPRVKKLELKPLPSHLKYAFLDDAEECHVIVSTKLTDNQLSQLLTVLRMHKKAIGYSIDDLKGISPDFCMHRINLEENHRPCIQPQRRLNPNMQEVVKKEIMKLLDAGIIYPISDSNWVSFRFPFTQRSGEDDVHLPYDTFAYRRIPFGMCKPLPHFRDVDKAKIEVIEKLPPPVNVKGVRSFLGHAGFYRRFIKDFSKIAKPLTQLLLKDATFDFTDACVESFDRIKEALITAPIIQPPDWSLLSRSCVMLGLCVGLCLVKEKQSPPCHLLCQQDLR